MPAAPTIPANSAKPAAPAAGFCFARSDRASVRAGLSPPGSAPAPRTGL
nr:MAG TPA_asm: hypothetical protein [Caudoviricetes sp.]